MLDEALREIRRRKWERIVVFTGAGVSADSGIPTFRGVGGLWRNFRAEDLATPDAFARDPALVWEWYEWRRELVRSAQPNAAHRAIASLDRALVVTQNVDSLHARAGSRKIIELHGNLFRVRCTREGTTHDATAPFAELPPRCECGALLRPDVVWFGELPYDLDRIEQAVVSCDLFVSVGTSGAVYPAAGYVALAAAFGARTLELNLEPSDAAVPFDEVRAGPATEVVPAWVAEVLVT